MRVHTSENDVGEPLPGRLVFHPSDPHTIPLERAQHGRESYRRAQARAQFTRTHAQPAPASAAPQAQPVAPGQEGTAQPPTRAIAAPAPPVPVPAARPWLARLRKAVRRLFRRT
ncbi:hypothetical protein [Streptomyces beijiangensis]|uniref:Uncharacterized protein n=1 Tax=Streptomyces beijiangensis TaxID=163361 RepID=A0A939JLN0_9ACTN|nr:hypothetical protein [Streptomyces beijiangensis]MBO0516575.1 hypothetical protein [Streptomyces beijiangensis]